jgi:hypothetical protein
MLRTLVVGLILSVPVHHTESSEAFSQRELHPHGEGSHTLGK